MTAFTRGRIIAAAGVLSLSGLFGAAVAVPAPHQDVRTTMQYEGTPTMTEEGFIEGTPQTFQEATLADFHEGTPQTFQE